MYRVTGLFENKNIIYIRKRLITVPTKTYKYCKIYTKTYESRGHLCENVIPTCKSIPKHIDQETSCAKTCNASLACSKTKIIYTKKYNHGVFCTKTYKSYYYYVCHPTMCSVCQSQKMTKKQQ